MSTKQWLTPPDIAETLQVTIPTVHVYRKNNGLPAHRVGRLYRFDPDEFDAWLAGRDTTCAGSPHRDAIVRLVDAAPELTAEQADRIAAILGGGK